MAINPNTDFTAGQVLTADQQNRFPRGVVGAATRSAGNLTISSPVADVTSMTTTFTADSTRLYKISWSIAGQKSAAAGRIDIFITNSSNVNFNVYSQTQPASDFYEMSGVIYTSGISGSKTVKMRANCTVGTATIYADGPTASGSPFLIVEDIGPA